MVAHWDDWDGGWKTVFLWLLAVPSISIPLSVFLPRFPVANQPSFWLFGASAQAVATLFAFILAGYQLADAQLDEMDDQDEEERQIKERLKERDFHHLKALSAFSGIAIVGSLLLISVNDVGYPLRRPLTLTTGSYILISVVLSILVVLRVVDPGRRPGAARELIGEGRPPSPEAERPGKAVHRAVFIDAFIDLETDLRRLLEARARELDIDPGERLGFGRLARELHRLDILERPLYHELQELGRLRNLVVHGHLDEVEAGYHEHLVSTHRELSQDFAEVRGPTEA